MQTVVMSSNEARTNWAEILDKVIAGEAVSIERYGRPLAVVISQRMWKDILDAFKRLDDVEDTLAVYRAELRRLKGQSNQPVSDKELDEWLAVDEPVRA